MNTAPVAHKSVLVKEVLEYLAPQDGGIYLDCTFGAGGHTRAILDAANCSVIALDWDTKSLEQFGQSLKEQYGNRLTLLWGNFAHLYKLLREHKIDRINGVLADFGTSQMQITERAGFSVHRSTPLDMRMSPAHYQVTAQELLMHSSEQKLRSIFEQLGEERYAKQIAQAIVKARLTKQIKTTQQLVEIVDGAVPTSYKHRRIHPATLVFQALRIYVNHELENIQSLMSIAPDIIKPGGRIVCISFHSLEDRLVKQAMLNWQNEGAAELLTQKVVMASEEELAVNRAARSARLRAAQMILK